MARKLASIQRIKEVSPIEYSDNIELVRVLGWQVVTKKGQFKRNDLVVYIEVDSILPEREEFNFLKSKGMRIRTIRLRGHVSQGICFPLDILPENLRAEPDDDVTDILGITKYEPPIPACLSGIKKGDFPSFIPKTDETRVQILQYLLNRYEGQSFYVTEKIDGSSATYYIKDGVFGVCSRNLELEYNIENSFWKIAKEYDIENKLRKLNRNVAIQGELYGESIQSNPLKIRGQNIRFFNVFDIDSFEYEDYSKFKKTLTSLDLPIIPIIDSDYKLPTDIDSIVKFATIKSTINPKSWAEGIVLRPKKEKLDLQLSTGVMTNARVSFKAINPEYLISINE